MHGSHILWQIYTFMARVHWKKLGSSTCPCTLLACHPKHTGGKGHDHQRLHRRRRNVTLGCRWWWWWCIKMPFTVVASIVCVLLHAGQSKTVSNRQTGSVSSSVSGHSSSSSSSCEFGTEVVAPAPPPTVKWLCIWFGVV